MTMTRREAGQHLRSLMEANYEGRSVRTPAEFRHDLEALRIAADVLDPPSDETTVEPTPVAPVAPAEGVLLP